MPRVSCHSLTRLRLKSIVADYCVAKDTSRCSATRNKNRNCVVQRSRKHHKGNGSFLVVFLQRRIALSRARRRRMKKKKKKPLTYHIVVESLRRLFSCPKFLMWVLALMCFVVRVQTWHARQPRMFGCTCLGFSVFSPLLECFTVFASIGLDNAPSRDKGETLAAVLKQLGIRGFVLNSFCRNTGSLSYTNMHWPSPPWAI